MLAAEAKNGHRAAASVPAIRWPPGPRGQQDRQADQTPGSFHSVRRIGQRIDGQWDRAGLALDVPGHHDRGPELAQAAGEGQHEAGDQAPPGQGQGHGKESAQAAGSQAPSGHLKTRIDPLKRQADRANHERKTDHGRRQGRPQPGEHDLDSKPLPQ